MAARRHTPGETLRADLPAFEELLAQFEVERTLGWLFHDIHRLLSRGFERRAQHLRMSRAQWRALMLIHHNDGLTQTALAELIDIEKAPFGRLLDKLERAGWIVRKPDPKDRRAKRVHATDKILPLMPGALQAASALFRDALRGFSEAEICALIERLTLFKQNLIAADGAHDPAPPA